MIRTLLIITGASLVLCIATLAGAAAIGGDELARNGWAWTFHDEDGDDVRFERVTQDAGADVTRTLPWTGGGMLAIDIPGEVTYVQGAAKTITITGPKDIADRVQLLTGDRLTFNDGDDTERVSVRWGPNGLRALADGDRLKITVTAPDVKIFNLSSSADLFVRNYDQPRLALIISGSGQAIIQGRTQDARLDITGSGEADLSELALTDASVDIDGSGEARLGATGRVDVDISGSGDVVLTRRPASLNQTISGSGDVRQD